MSRTPPLALRIVAVSSAFLLAYSSGAAGFNSILSSASSAVTLKVRQLEGIPMFSERPGSVYRGPNPGRDPARRRMWNDGLLEGLRQIETERTLRQFLEHGGGDAALGDFGFSQVLGGTGATTDNYSGGAGVAGEGVTSSGESGSASVNTNTGNRVTSLGFGGWTSRAGMAVPFTLTHNSIGAFDGNVGKGWSSSYEARVSGSGTTAVVRLPDGLSIPFTTPAPGGQYTAAPGRYEQLAQVYGGTWTLRFKDRTVWNFNSAGFMTSMVDRSGNTISLTRDASGLLTKVTDPVGRELKFAYDATNRIQTVTDPMNRVWSLGYNPNGNLTSIQYPDMANGLGAPKREFGYDASNRIVSEKDLRGKTWTTQYDASGRLWKETNPLSQTTAYTYTASSCRVDLPLALGSGQVDNYSGGRLASRVDEAGFSEAYTAYDANGNVTSTTDKSGKIWGTTYDARGNQLTQTDPLGKTWTYTYSTQNELLTATSPLGRTTAYAYDSSGLITKVTDALGHDKVTAQYDTFGQPQWVKDALGRQTTFAFSAGVMYQVTDSAGVARYYSYNADGRMNATSDAASKLWLFGRDGWGRPNGVTFPGGAYTLTALDGNGRSVSARDEINRTTTYAYDDAGRRVSTTNPKGEVEVRAYNANGWLGTVRDGNLHLTTFAYNPRGDRYWIELADGARDWWARTGRGEEVYHQHPDGTVVYSSFDDAMRPTLVNYPGATTDESFGYDDDGRRTSMTDGVGTTTWTIDAADRVTAISQPYGTVTYTYNDADQRTKLTEAQGGTTLGDTLYGYDVSGRPGTTTNRFGETTTLAYDTLSRLLSTQFANGAKETYGYDNRDRRTGITLKNAGGTTLRTENYVYTDAGQISSHTVDGAATTYGYDLAAQLASESRSGYSGSYTYDANGNRLTRTVNGVTETFAYDVGDKLQTVKIGGVTQRSYTYNAAGSATSVTTSAGTTNVTWDAAERARTISGPGLTGTSAFAYNGLGARLSATENGVVRQDLRDGVRVTAPVLEDSLASYTPGISERRGGVSTFDHAGIKSFAAQTSAAGALSATRQYDAFGNVLASTGSFAGPFAYGGALGYRTDASGLSLLGHRLYDSSAGRFLSRDPVRAGRNWYAYCANDPVGNADPSGLSDFDLGGPYTVKIPPRYPESAVGGGLGDFGGGAVDPPKVPNPGPTPDPSPGVGGSTGEEGKVKGGATSQAGAGKASFDVEGKPGDPATGTGTLTVKIGPGELYGSGKVAVGDGPSYTIGGSLGGGLISGKVEFLPGGGQSGGIGLKLGPVTLTGSFDEDWKFKGGKAVISFPLRTR